MIARTAAVSLGTAFALELLITTIVRAASPDIVPDRVNDFVNAYLKKKQIPGCAVTVRHDGKVAVASVNGHLRFHADE